ncbi:MAG: hypothetical protein WBB65_03935 [Anaerolineales bacterium]
MRRREVYKHDVFDSYVSRLFKNWAFEFPLPKNGRLLLLKQVKQTTDNPFLWFYLPLAVARWSFRNLILEPIDIAFQPVLYFSDVDLYPTYVTDKMLHQSFIG